MKTIILAAFIGLVISLPCALADEKKKRFYVGGDLKLTRVDGSAALPVSRVTFTAAIGEPTFQQRAIPFPAANVRIQDSDRGWSGYGGIRVFSFLSLELGYSSLGEFKEDLQIQALIPPLAFFPFGTAVPLRPLTSITADQIYLATRFEFSLTKWLDANWTMGLSRTDFGVKYPPSSISSLFFPPFTLPVASQNRIDYRAPSNKTGYLWGFGFTWNVTNSIGITARYRQNDVKVEEIEEFALGLEFSF